MNHFVSVLCKTETQKRNEERKKASQPSFIHHKRTLKTTAIQIGVGPSGRTRKKTLTKTW
jgi:hypothetical protein